MNILLFFFQIIAWVVLLTFSLSVILMSVRSAVFPYLLWHYRLSFKFLLIRGEELFHCSNLHALIHAFSNSLALYHLSAHAVIFVFDIRMSVSYWMPYIEYNHFWYLLQILLFPFDFVSCVLAPRVFDRYSNFFFLKLKSRKKCCLKKLYK